MKSNYKHYKTLNYQTILKTKNKDFYNYLTCINASTKILNKALILLKNQSFYYEVNEVRKFNTIINCNKLNYIKELKNFLNSLYYTSNKNTYFCGCFISNKSPKHFSGKHKFRKFLKALGLVIVSAMSRLLSKKDVQLLLKKYRFEIIDMKEIRGVTYFYAKKI